MGRPDARAPPPPSLSQSTLKVNFDAAHTVSTLCTLMPVSGPRTHNISGAVATASKPAGVDEFALRHCSALGSPL